MDRNRKLRFKERAGKAWQVIKEILLWTIVILTIGSILGSIADLFRGRK